MHCRQQAPQPVPAGMQDGAAQLCPIIGLSESEAGASLPLMQGRTQDSQCAEGQPTPPSRQKQQDQAARPSAGGLTRQNVSREEGAGPLWLDDEDIFADASLEWSVLAALKM